MNDQHVVIASCDFNEGDLLKPYTNEIVSHYFKYIDSEKGYNVRYTNPLIKETIIPRIVNIIKNNFEADIIDVSDELHVYVQNNKEYYSVIHNHVNCFPGKIDPSLSLTFYNHVPKHGGEFQIITNLDGQDNKQFTVEDRKLYFFPSWLFHRPLPQQNEEYRICFNYNITTTNRPKFIPGNVVW